MNKLDVFMPTVNFSPTSINLKDVSWQQLAKVTVEKQLNTVKYCHFIPMVLYSSSVVDSGVPRNLVWGGSTNSVEDRGQREQGSGGGSPLVRGSAQFAYE
jgi:hypothetical protein